jgi:glycosyltransferase involved in cell wall biosynthesis
MPDKPEILFLSYNGLLEPILPSQAIPYMTDLAAKGFAFTLVTYEKKKDLERAGPVALKRLKDGLRSKGIDWQYLRYHKYPPVISTLFDLAVGAMRVLDIARNKDIAVVHVRGITPGMIALALSGLLRSRVLFDMRGLLSEEYVGGGLWKECGLAFKLVKTAEKRLLQRADAVAVLTNKHLELNKSLSYLNSRAIPMEVIPCCVDMKRFGRDSRDNSLRSELGLGDKFVLMYPGKIGTFYMMREMVEFFAAVADIIPDSVFLILTNDDTAGVSEMAGNIGIGGSRLKIVRGIQFEQMPRYISVADAGVFFINPYKKIGSSPIKMGEFLASGIPVVINPGVGDTEELVLDNKVGVVIRQFDRGCYIDAARELVEIKKGGQALISRCRAAAEKHLSLELAADKYAKIYALLTEKRR